MTKPCLVDRVVPLDDVAVMVDEDQAGELDLREVDRHRIGPVELRVLGIADREMPGEAEVESPLGEGPAGGDEMPLAVVAQLGQVVRPELPGKDQPLLLRLIDGTCDLRGQAWPAPASGVVVHRGAQRPGTRPRAVRSFSDCPRKVNVWGSQGILRWPNRRSDWRGVIRHLRPGRCARRVTSDYALPIRPTDIARPARFFDAPRIRARHASNGRMLRGSG